MVKHASQFQLVMGIREESDYTLVDYKLDGSDCGLYMRGFRNSFGTTLAVRGTRAELEALVAQL